MMRYIPINEFIVPDARAIVESRSRQPPSCRSEPFSVALRGHSGAGQPVRRIAMIARRFASLASLRRARLAMPWRAPLERGRVALTRSPVAVPAGVRVRNRRETPSAGSALRRSRMSRARAAAPDRTIRSGAIRGWRPGETEGRSRRNASVLGAQRDRRAGADHRVDFLDIGVLHRDAAGGPVSLARPLGIRLAMDEDVAARI